MRHAILSSALLLLGAQSAHAVTITQLKSDTVYEVHADGTYTVEESGTVRIENAQGVRSAGQLALGYSSSLQKLEVLEAYTTTKDGKRLDVGPDGMRDQEARASAGAPTFSDRKSKAIIFPQVEVGSMVSARWRRTQLKPDIPGLFSMWESIPRSIDSEAATVTLRAPANLTLHIDTRDVDGGEIADPPAGMHEWRWTFKPSKGQPPEPRQVNSRDTGPYIMVSTFESWDDLAKAYDSRAADMAKPSPAIRKLADEITAGIKDRRAQAKALYEWVGKNIRYVAILLEDGGFVPHSADAIYAARYGDCKDHTVMLAALLTAKKIASSAVILNASDSYFVPKIVTPHAFNHAITWLPEFDLFVDSTPGLLPFGVLAPAEYGKQVLVIDAGKGKPALRKLPLISPERDWIASRVDLAIAADGTMSGTVSGESAGMYEAADRQIFAAIPTDQRQQFANRALAGRGTAKIEAGDPRDFGKPFTYVTKVEMPQLVNLPGPGANHIPMGSGRFSGSIGSFVTMMSEPMRTLPMLCPAAGRRSEVAHVKLAPGMKTTHLPEGVKLTTKYGSYESKYEQVDDTLVASSTLTLEYPDAVCAPEDYADLRDFATAIGKDIRQQYLYD